MKSRKFNKIFFLFIFMELVIFGGIIVYKDPFFYYHRPFNDNYHLEWAYPRYYNDGILKHFEYDSIILGTSMCNNFRTSKVETLFGMDETIKINASGSYFNETNVYLQEAFACNPDIKLIVRSIDLDCLNLTKDTESIYAREAYYLRDNNIFNDVNYIFSKKAMLECWKVGHVSWDEYLSWRGRPTGRKYLLGDSVWNREEIPKQEQLDDNTVRQVFENVKQNIVNIMEENPNTEFYLFFTPYSVCVWEEWLYSGELDKQIQIQKIAIEEILECKNVHLFSFCNDFKTVSNLDNYIDKKHYAEWVNDGMLDYMYQGIYQLTKDNYMDYLDEIAVFYMTYPYDSLYKD